MTIFPHNVPAPTSLQARDYLSAPAVSAGLIAVVLFVIGMTSESGLIQLLAGLAAFTTAALSLSASAVALMAPAQKQQG
ncbi:hypothetical protein BJY21_002280 [Kineosphaera limosa]|uniref:Uncharacterized protein n=1 Tax=Kineosphaera limosa NBRC 100340 TaxID=1184609 RepID=K6XEI2_9MICO|nr:hypothetical protein [Kineosphaera limosa]NYE01096.1 hypothetical protein [Kineosphaera limosa]GAB97229.1 hypothetical protein KILIM_061_00130 [Kineosphaera limosa NBRC 100340]